MFPREWLLTSEKTEKPVGERYVYALPDGSLVEIIRNALTMGGLQGLWEIRYASPTGVLERYGYRTTSEAKELLEQFVYDRKI